LASVKIKGGLQVRPSLLGGFKSNEKSTVVFGFEVLQK